MRDTSNRYTRQQRVPQLSGCAQQKLAAAKVLIVGAGGLGSPVSLFLAGAGVGDITLVDPDIVSLSNLHRQILFQEADVNKAKVGVAQKRLTQLNSQIKLTAIQQSLNIDNVDSLVSQASIVVDAADNFLVSYLLSDACLTMRTPLVSASVLVTHGYLGVFCGTQEQPAPSLRALFPSPSSATKNCNNAGVTGPSVGIMGSYQAQEVLKVAIGDASQLRGKLMTLDLWDYRQHIIDFNNAQEPKNKANFVSLNNLNNGDIVLDVRSEKEHQAEPLTINAKNIPLDQLTDRLQELDPTRVIHCVCRSGQRALVAASVLINHDFTQVNVAS